ncbi:MAG: phosphatidylserine/phosphatidylglycerophosphate/cardiolipin synthase family protein [Gammaproteobacteria bacterium]|nr:phosphatidylserine/phosphatidylglycerophosphate/cardiolipin synthase family protein [Gammaproteobacteria bacterium]MBT8135220.1 phosphatidylserine/phosphatidylglycerophosphate/cardiolipin synthase family protein [Gammaproteobacteria bacterium]NNJ50788.1 phosphatidylserine/phosphatidylglycerophosphate/cardiolipin synthase family protein [Gammaproteobacteria bacterium]
MAKSVIAALITLSVITGCASGPVELETPQPSIVIDDTVVDTSVLLAEQAYINDNQLFIQFRHQSDTIDSFAILPEPDETMASGSSTTLYLQQAIDQFNDLPLAQLTHIGSEQWIEQTHGLKPFPVASVALWREFRDRLFASITPQERGTGIVVEFLKQEELFFYFDESGLLQSVTLQDKPAGLSTSDTFRFSELLSDATTLLSEYIVAAKGIAQPAADTPALLFNTGDTADYGYPFIYANHHTGQVVFLRRDPEDTECCDPEGGMLPQGLGHITRSHVEGFLRQPIGSVARLFTLVSHKVVDTVTPKSVIVLQAQPIPPVSDSEPMDPEAWELELNELAYSPLSQGSIEYLVDGESFFPRLIDAIQSAEESIDIRLYIFDNDDYALKIANLLKQRSKDIRVRILVDGLGTISAASATSSSMPEDYETRPKIVRYMETDSNVDVRIGLNPWLTGDHTKTILVDKRIAYLGGMNIGREYRYDWHDLMVELRGPIVDEIQTNFEKAWLLQSFLGDIRSTFYRPDDPVNQPLPDHIPIRLLYTKPGDSQILRTQLAAITRARQRIYIQNAYFTSDDIIYELAQARRRGVDVRIIIPYQSDSGIINRSNVRAINTMLDNGIRVFIYPGESHIKGAVYDGWICLGSANFDQLSLRMNKELNIATSSPSAVQGFLNEVMLPDFEKSVELKEQLPKKWSDFLMETIADQL